MTIQRAGLPPIAATPVPVQSKEQEDDLYLRASKMVSVSGEHPVPPLPDEPGLPGKQMVLIHPDDHSEWGGAVYDAQSFLARRLNLPANGTLQLFHQTKHEWADPGAKTSIRQANGSGGYGGGFYTSTQPEKSYGGDQLQVGIPVSAFAGKKLFEVTAMWNGGEYLMPRGVDVAVVRHEDRYWFVFKRGSEAWLNASATTLRFDKPGDTDGWDG